MSSAAQAPGNDLNKVDVPIPSNENTEEHNSGSSNPKTASNEHHAKRKPLILVVDDDARFADSIANALTRTGYDVLKAYDGNVGLAMALVKRPELIVLDSRMRKRSGYLVLEYLRTHLDSPIPVIMLSENEGTRHQTYALMLGAAAFLAKPIEADKVVNAVVDTMQRVYNLAK
ncbi:MAG: response regulator [Planctomycetota bacterium]